MSPYAGIPHHVPVVAPSCHNHRPDHTAPLRQTAKAARLDGYPRNLSGGGMSPEVTACSAEVTAKSGGKGAPQPWRPYTPTVAAATRPATFFLSAAGSFVTVL